MSFDYMQFAIQMKMFAEIDNADEYMASMSPNQVASKQWLVDELYACYMNRSQLFDSPDLLINDAEIIGSWYGWPLVGMLEQHKRIQINHYTMWDIDKNARINCLKYAKLSKMTDRVTVISKDYWNHARTGSAAELIINTSSEHMEHTFDKMLEYGNPFYVNKPIVVIQCNNMSHLEEHIACVNSLDELVDRHKLSELYYAGEQDWVDLSGKTFTRYMIIGRL